MITKQDEDMFKLWLCSPGMKMSEAFSIYRQQLLGPDDDTLVEKFLQETFDEFMSKNYD